MPTPGAPSRCRQWNWVFVGIVTVVFYSALMVLYVHFLFIIQQELVNGYLLYDL